MTVFWILAALVSGLAAFLILARAALAERGPPPADPALGVYRRQLEELDDLADRGLLGEDERRSARAEAGRRLIGEADRALAAAPAPGEDRVKRLVVWVAVLAPALALTLYLALGSPGLPDQPYQERLRTWRANPSRLDLPKMVAVLQEVAAERPRDPQALVYLAGAQAAQGDARSAARTLQKATQIAPNDPKVWTSLGEVLTAGAQGEVNDDARTAFERARVLDPGAPAPRYYLAQAKIASGHAAQGLEDWRALAASLPAGGADRTALEADIAEVARTGRLPAAQTAPQQAAANGGEQAAFIQSMVDRLAARLKAQPDDPAGWARLIRAYGVLGQTARRQEAVAAAQRLFKDRPDALKTALAGEGPAAP